jgi:predicted nucleic acid-binding protein
VTRLAIDSSSLIAYLGGRNRADTRLVHDALERGEAVLPPVVVTEVLSQPGLPREVADLLQTIATLELTEGYWQRAGATRALVAAKGRRARLADALIAQVCLDHDVTLVTNDADFRAFASIARLRVVP